MTWLGSLGANALATNVTAGKGFGLEVIMTFLLMFTVMAMIDPGRVSNGFAPLAIGLSIFIAHLIGIPFTGCGINPARSLGPAVVASKWDDHWVFWIGPLVGAGIAALLYGSGSQRNVRRAISLKFLPKAQNILPLLLATQHRYHLRWMLNLGSQPLS